MNKQEFLTRLGKGLSGLPPQDIEERLTFYGEMIDDRIEDGLLEEEAVEAIGDIEEIAAQIITETPLAKLAKEKLKPKRSLRGWEILLLALGSPVWLALLMAGLAVLLAVYAVLWAAIVALWSVEAALWCCTLCGIVAGAVTALRGSGLTGAALIGAGLVCGGLSVFLFIGCRAATKGILLLTRNLAQGIKHSLMKKEGVQ